MATAQQIFCLDGMRAVRPFGFWLVSEVGVIMFGLVRLKISFGRCSLSLLLPKQRQSLWHKGYSKCDDELARRKKRTSVASRALWKAKNAAAKSLSVRACDSFELPLFKSRFRRFK